VAAESWGCKPWDLAGGDPLTWFLRFIEFQNAKQNRQDLEAQRMKKEWQK